MFLNEFLFMEGLAKELFKKLTSKPTRTAKFSISVVKPHIDSSPLLVDVKRQVCPLATEDSGDSGYVF